MELEDYGDINHKHGHIHSKPEIYQKTIDTALKDWCVDVIDSDEEKCDSLNQSFFEEILTGSIKNKVNLSKIYELISQLSKLSNTCGASGASDESGASSKYKITINGTNVILQKGDNVYEQELKIKNENGDLKLFTIFSVKKEDEISDRNLIELELSNNNFKLSTIVIKYTDNSENIISKLKSELQNVNLKELMDKNKEIMKNISNNNKKIDKQRIIIPDSITGKRRLINLEKWDRDIFMELMVLLMYLIIGICFGIYCIYNFFVIELK